MNSFCTFMASTTGRIIRIVAGIVLIVWGWMGLGGTAGIVVAHYRLSPVIGWSV